MIGIARKYCKDKGNFFCADFENAKFKPATFDLIIASYSIIYSKNIEKVFKRFYRILKPRGRVIFSLYHPVQ